MSVTEPTQGVPASLLVPGGVAVLASLLGNAILALTADAVEIAPEFAHLELPRVLLFSTAGAVGAVVVYAWLRRRHDDPNRTFVRVASVVLLVSFVPDVELLTSNDAATLPAVLVLMAMHVVAIASVLSLVRLGPR